MPWFKWFKFKKKKHGPVSLEKGWQFYSRPTTLEPPGWIFRVDKDGKRFLVTEIAVECKEGHEAEVSEEHVIKTNADIIARFLGIKSVNLRAGVRRNKRMTFEMSAPVRQVLTDAAIREAVRQFRKEWPFEEGNQYFLIRDARKTIAMKYRLSGDLFTEIGGDAAVNQAINAGANIGFNRGDTVEIDQTFREEMFVMFQAERILPPIKAVPIRDTFSSTSPLRTIPLRATSTFSGKSPQLGLRPVSKVLTWEEGEP